MRARRCVLEQRITKWDVRALLSVHDVWHIVPDVYRIDPGATWCAILCDPDGIVLPGRIAIIQPTCPDCIKRHTETSAPTNPTPEADL